ncbi:MAG: hypothetical protein ACI33P_10770 [Lysinibacillus sp.]
MVNFFSFSGTVTAIEDFMVDNDGGCNQLMSVQNEKGEIVNFVVSPTTYFVDQAMVLVGDRVTGYYDGDAPAILIYPPQHPALVVVKESPYQNVKVGYFDNQLVSSDGQLKLNLSPHTAIMLRNGQPFTRYPAGRNLIVIYGASTRSIPAQTTPSAIIVWC